MRRTTTNSDDKQAEEGGFTLLELMIIVAVIAVLLGIAIPTFMSAKGRSGDAAAKSRASHAAKEQRTVWSDAGASYANASALAAQDKSQAYEPYGGGPVPAVLGVVYVRNDAGDLVTMVSRSNSGRCFWTKEHAGITSYAVNNCEGPPGEPAGAGLPPHPGTWDRSW